MIHDEGGRTEDCQGTGARNWAINSNRQVTSTVPSYTALTVGMLVC